MCIHNETCEDCENCCYAQGYQDAIRGFRQDCEYRYFDQRMAYNKGYDQALIELSD